MTIVLNHTIVPARDKEASAQFFADIFGLKDGGTSKELWLRSSLIFLHLHQSWNLAIYLLNPVIA